MSIFLNSILENATEVNYDVPVYEGFVNPEPEGLSYIMQEAMMENYQMQASVMVMDAVNYSRVTEGHDTIVTENAVSNVFKKMKEAWIKLWSKVKAWFTKTIEGLKVVFMDGENFVKRYKNDILRVDAKKFKYKGYNWKISDGESAINKYQSTLSSLEGDANKQYPTSGNVKTDTEQVSSSDFVEDTIYKKLGEDSMADIKKDVVDKYKNGETSPVEIEGFSAVSLEAMIKFVEDNKKTLKDIENDRKESDKAFKENIKKIDEASKEAAKAQSSNDMTTDAGKASNKTHSRIISNATNLNSALKTIQSIRMGLVSTRVSINRAIFNEFVRVMKSVRTHRAVQESVTESASSSDDVFTAIFEGFRN